MSESSAVFPVFPVFPKSVSTLVSPVFPELLESDFSYSLASLLLLTHEIITIDKNKISARIKTLFMSAPR